MFTCSPPTSRFANAPRPRLTWRGGLLATVIALGLIFVPPPGTASALNYEVNLVGQAAS
jgi:hypothetical protein